MLVVSTNVDFLVGQNDYEAFRWFESPANHGSVVAMHKVAALSRARSRSRMLMSGRQAPRRENTSPCPLK